MLLFPPYLLFVLTVLAIGSKSVPGHPIIKEFTKGASGLASIAPFMSLDVIRWDEDGLTTLPLVTIVQHHRHSIYF